MLKADSLASFASAVRMIHRIHGRTSDAGTDTHPAATAGFSDIDGIMFKIAHSPYCGIAIAINQPDFTGGHFYLGSPFIHGCQDRSGTGASDYLSAMAWK